MLVDNGKLLLQMPSELSCVLPLALSLMNQLLVFVGKCAALLGKCVALLGKCTVLLGKSAFVFRHTAIDRSLYS